MIKNCHKLQISYFMCDLYCTKGFKRAFYKFQGLKKITSTLKD